MFKHVCVYILLQTAPTDVESRPDAAAKKRLFRSHGPDSSPVQVCGIVNLEYLIFDFVISLFYPFNTCQL